jgi:hypothetical protein
MNHRTYLKPVAAAEKIGVTVGTLANWRWKGFGPAYYAIGGMIRYADEEIDTWIATGRQAVGTDRGRSGGGARP